MTQVKQIKALTLSKFRLNHCFTHLDMTCQITAFVLVPEDEPYISALSAAFKEFDDVIKKQSGNSHTAELKQASDAVEEAWRGARAQARAQLKHPAADKRAAAAKAYAAFEKYGDVSLMTQSDMHAAIKNLLQDLQLLSEEELTLIDLKAWVDLLDSTHTTYVTAYLAQSNEYGTKEDGLVASRRLDAENAYYAMVRRINAGAEYNGDAPYVEFIDKLNGLVEKMDTLFASTAYGGKGDPDAPADPELPAE